MAQPCSHRGQVMLGRTIIHSTLSPEFTVPLQLSPHTAGSQRITVRVGILSLRCGCIGPYATGTNDGPFLQWYQHGHMGAQDLLLGEAAFTLSSLVESPSQRMCLPLSTTHSVTVVAEVLSSVQGGVLQAKLVGSGLASQGGAFFLVRKDPGDGSWAAVYGSEVTEVRPGVRGPPCFDHAGAEVWPCVLACVRAGRSRPYVATRAAAHQHFVQR
jgi:hypothetical protein